MQLKVLDDSGCSLCTKKEASLNLLIPNIYQLYLKQIGRLERVFLICMNLFHLKNIAFFFFCYKQTEHSIKKVPRKRGTPYVYRWFMQKNQTKKGNMYLQKTATKPNPLVTKTI